MYSWLGRQATLTTRTQSCPLLSTRGVLPSRVQGMECCQGLQKVLDEYTAKKQQGRIHLPPGADEANQHGFLVPFAVM